MSVEGDKDKEVKTEADENQREKFESTPMFDTKEEAKDYFKADDVSLKGFTSDPQFIGPEGYAWYDVGGQVVLIKHK